MFEKFYFVKALYDFSDIEIGEVALKPGDVICTLFQVDDNWCHGINLTDEMKKGVFPLYFTTPYHRHHIREMPLSSFCLTIVSFHTTVPGDLNFDTNQLISLKRQIDDNWAFGMDRHGNVGMFPLAFVKKLNLDQQISCHENNNNNNKIEEENILIDLTNEDKNKKVENKVRTDPTDHKEEFEDLTYAKVIAKGMALLDYEGELSFKENDVIEILRVKDLNFAIARLNGKLGKVPLDYIYITEHEELILPEFNERSKFDWWKKDENNSIVEEASEKLFKDFNSNLKINLDEGTKKSETNFYPKQREEDSYLFKNQTLFSSNFLTSFPPSPLLRHAASPPPPPLLPRTHFSTSFSQTPPLPDRDYFSSSSTSSLSSTFSCTHLISKNELENYYQNNTTNNPENNKNNTKHKSNNNNLIDLCLDNVFTNLDDNKCNEYNLFESKVPSSSSHLTTLVSSSQSFFPPKLQKSYYTDSTTNDFEIINEVPIIFTLNNKSDSTLDLLKSHFKPQTSPTPITTPQASPSTSQTLPSTSPLKDDEIKSNLKNEEEEEENFYEAIDNFYDHLDSGLAKNLNEDYKINPSPHDSPPIPHSRTKNNYYKNYINYNDKSKEQNSFFSVSPTNQPKHLTLLVPTRPAPPRPSQVFLRNFKTEENEYKLNDSSNNFYSFNEYGDTFNNNCNNNNSNYKTENENRNTIDYDDKKKKNKEKEEDIYEEINYGDQEPEEIKKKIEKIETSLYEILKENRKMSVGKDSARVKENHKNIGTLTDQLSYLKELEKKLSCSTNLVSQEATNENLNKKEKRIKILKEIINTEKDFYNSISFLNEVFHDEPPPSSFNLEITFSNLDQIISISKQLLILMETNVENKQFQNQLMGACFLEIIDNLKFAYASYCKKFDDVVYYLSRLESDDEVQVFIKKKVTQMKNKNLIVFNFVSMLIKPVQRVLKYPLLAAQLLKQTEPFHPDFDLLVTAVDHLEGVAVHINEYKRRKDLVMKYKRTDEEGLMERLSKLSVHSIKKKINRLITPNVTNEEFDIEHDKFKVTLGFTLSFHNFITSFLENLKDSLDNKLVLLLFISDYYGKCSEQERQLVNKLNMSYSFIRSSLYLNLKKELVKKVIEPIKVLLGCLRGPQELVVKRQDKLKDQMIAGGRVRSYPSDLESKNEFEQARKDYEALHYQLLEELPILIKDSNQLIFKSIVLFSLLYKRFLNLAKNHLENSNFSCLFSSSSFSSDSFFVVPDLPPLSPLLNSPVSSPSFSTSPEISLDNPSNPITKYKQIFEALALSSSSLSSTPLSCASFPSLSSSSSFTGSFSNHSNSAQFYLNESKEKEQIGQIGSKTQTEENKNKVLEKYKGQYVYEVASSFQGNQDLDLKVEEGEVVGVVKFHDYNGNDQRWFVDLGDTKGFILKSHLKKYKQSNKEII